MEGEARLDIADALFENAKREIEKKHEPLQVEQLMTIPELDQELMPPRSSKVHAACYVAAVAQILCLKDLVFMSASSLDQAKSSSNSLTKLFLLPPQLRLRSAIPLETPHH